MALQATMEMRIQVGSGLPACRGALWARFRPARRAEARRQPRRADPTSRSAQLPVLDFDRR